MKKLPRGHFGARLLKIPPPPRLTFKNKHGVLLVICGCLLSFAAVFACPFEEDARGRVVFSGVDKAQTINTRDMNNRNFYCEYCGRPFKSVSELTRAGLCTRHPDGPARGKHKLYEGTEKAVYTCKYCGAEARTIERLTSSFCVHHPKGHNRGRHAPAL